ncbi:MAG: ribosome maturation factor RimP, partial [Acetobacteraceae bacterium]
MADRSLPPALQRRIADLVAPALEAMGYELVRVALSGGRALNVQIMAERADGRAMALLDCEQISRRLGAALDVADPLSGPWTLEVSSPGIDRPLVRTKDWNRFSGHLARVELAAPVAGRRRLSGTVLGADERAAMLRLGDGTEVALPLTAIRRAQLILTEALMRATAP